MKYFFVMMFLTALTACSSLPKSEDKSEISWYDDCSLPGEGTPNKKPFFKPPSPHIESRDLRAK